MKKELSPLKRAVYLLEDIQVSSDVLRRELTGEDRLALAEGLKTIRNRSAAAASESDLQRAANDLLSLVEGHATWRRLLLTADMPARHQRDQWLEVREQELQVNLQQKMSVEELKMEIQNLDLNIRQAIVNLHTPEKTDE